MIVAIPIGRLMKIHRHDTPTSSPPTGGPTEAATAATPAQIPTTRVCWRARNDGYNSPSDVGTIMAAPTAWIARPAIKTPRSGARAHAAEASVKKAIPPPQSSPRALVDDVGTASDLLPVPGRLVTAVGVAP
jgi:hypothetical protein